MLSRTMVMIGTSGIVFGVVVVVEGGTVVVDAVGMDDVFEGHLSYAIAMDFVLICFQFEAMTIMIMMMIVWTLVVVS